MKKQKEHWSAFYWKKIYLKFFLKYMAGFLAILLPCILVVFVSWMITREQVITAGKARFQEGMAEIAAEISKMHIFANEVQNSDNFRMLSKMGDDISWGNYMYLYHASEEMTAKRSIYEFSPFFFVLFENNDIFVSSYQCDETFSAGYYGNLMEAYLSGEMLNVEEFCEMIMGGGNHRYSFLKLDDMTYHTDKQQKVENPIFCVVNKSYIQGSARTCRMSFLILPRNLTNLLLTEESLEEGFVRITDVEGNILLDYGDTSVIRESDSDISDIGSHWMISAREESETQWLVQIGIPKAVISEQMKTLYGLVYGYVILGIIMVLILSYHFGRKQYLELKKFYSLIPEYSYEEGMRVRDEYEVLMKIFGHMAEDSKRYMQQKADLDKQNQAIRLEKLIVGGIHTQEERLELKRANMISSEFYCVAIVRMTVREQQEYSMVLLSLNEYLQENWPDKIFHTHTGVYDELFLFPMASDSPPNVEDVKKLFVNAADIMTQEMGITLSVGISAVGMDVSALKRCYTQASHVLEAYYQEEKNIVNNYCIDIDNVKDCVINLDFLSQLHHHIIHLNTAELQKDFLLIKAYYNKHPVQFEAQKEQYFYSVRNIIYNAMLYFAVKPDEREELPVYEKEDTLEILTQKLLNASQWLIEKADARKRAIREQLREDILSYLETKYTDQSMSVNMACEELGVTERYLQTVIKDKTGDTFAVYLEKLRVKRAAELLLSTDYSNEQIAEEVGFVAISTFYRVFNKRMGMSPKAFREG